MKLSIGILSALVALNLCILSTGAFSVVPNTRKTTAFRLPTAVFDSPFFAEEIKPTEDDAGSDFDSQMPSSVYDRLGFAEDKVAVGVDANEVLQWLGNREDIVAKFLKDNKNFDQARAETEVDKFIMDAEMVNAFIAYEKKKSDPRFYRDAAEQQLSDPSTWGTYAVWIAGGAGFAYVKNVIVEPKYASGEWEEIHIKLPGADMFAPSTDAATTAVDAATATVDAISSSPAVDAVSSTVDAVSQAL